MTAAGAARGDGRDEVGAVAAVDQQQHGRQQVAEPDRAPPASARTMSAERRSAVAERGAAGDRPASWRGSALAAPGHHEQAEQGGEHGHRHDHDRDAERRRRPAPVGREAEARRAAGLRRDPRRSSRRSASASSSSSEASSGMTIVPHSGGKSGRSPGVRRRRRRAAAAAVVGSEIAHGRLPWHLPSTVAHAVWSSAIARSLSVDDVRACERTDGDPDRELSGSKVGHVDTGR